MCYKQHTQKPDYFNKHALKNTSNTNSDLLILYRLILKFSLLNVTLQFILHFQSIGKSALHETIFSLPFCVIS